MAFTKQEILRIIQDLQDQADALVGQGEYKLADQRLKRIKELKEQLKHLKDSMEVLKLSGFSVKDGDIILPQHEACGKDDDATEEGAIKKYGKEKGSFEDACNKDACTKDISVHQYAEKLRKEAGHSISHEQMAKELKKAGWSKEEAESEVLREAVNRVYGNKDACGEKVYTKGTQDAEYTTSVEKGKLGLWNWYVHKNGTIVAGGTSNTEGEARAQANAHLKKESHSKDACSNKDATYNYTEGDYKEEYKRLVQKRNNAQQGSTEYKKIQERLNTIRGKIKGSPFDNKDACTKDSDPKVAEAEALINLCGGVK